jgi:plasmid stabilization system protein ParE
VTPRVVWTPVAEEDLEDILFYIAVEGGRPETARRIGVEIVDAVNRHVQTGMPANRHPALPPGWFYLKHKRWLIAYERIDAGVVVHRVVDAVRDLPEQFKQS